jgi:hypothetical protein
MMRWLHDAHRTQVLRVTFAWHIYAPDSRWMRVTSESDVNVARTCHAKSQVVILGIGENIRVSTGDEPVTFGTNRLTWT